MKHTFSIYFAYFSLAIQCVAHSIFFYTIGMELFQLRYGSDLSPIQNLTVFILASLPLIIFTLFIKIQIMHRKIHDLELALITQRNLSKQEHS